MVMSMYKVGAKLLTAVAAEPTENRGGYLNSQDTNVW